MAVLLGMQDGEGNTPLHYLCAGNFDYRLEDSGTAGAEENSNIHVVGGVGRSSGIA